jgi:hypothetical protein
MKQYCVFCALMLAAFLAEPLAAAETTAARPNIVFILADDLGYMDVGCYNPKAFYETPSIDSLAKRGMKFTQGYAACNVCSPTRGSIMTESIRHASESLILSVALVQDNCFRRLTQTICRWRK